MKQNEEAAYNAAIAAAAKSCEEYPNAACYAHDKVVLTAIRAHCPDADRDLFDRFTKRAQKERSETGSSAAWAVGAVCNSKAAWMTPGFAEARRYSMIHGS